MASPQMTEKRITHIKMADGTLAPVEYLTEESQQPDYVRRLAKSAREASRAAIKRQLAAGLPAVFVKTTTSFASIPMDMRKSSRAISSNESNNSTNARICRSKRLWQEQIKRSWSGHKNNLDSILQSHVLSSCVLSSSHVSRLASKPRNGDAISPTR